LIRPDNAGSESTSSESLRAEVQRNAATIAELDRLSSSNNALLSKDDISGLSETHSGGSAVICGEQPWDEVDDQIRDDCDVGLDERGNMDGSLTGVSGQYRSCGTDIDEHASRNQFRRSLLLPTLHFLNRVNVESSVTSARASVSFRARAMIAEIDTYYEGSYRKVLEQSPFRSINPSLETREILKSAQEGSELAGATVQVIRRQGRQPPVALQPLDFDSL
jgi:hypothetical protein